MENATKALLIGAGMLFAIAIISIAWATYTNITGYYQEEQKSLTSEQLADFNKEYEAYNRDNVTGFELVSLINKVINYNSSNAVDSNWGYSNTDKNFQKMFVKFKLTDENLIKGIDKVKLFNSSEYDIEKSDKYNELVSKIEEMQKLENKYGANVLSKLVSDRENLAIYGGNGSKDIKQVLGKEQDVPNNKNDILKYEQYIEFKRAKFKCESTEHNNSTGRITKLIFVQK